MKANYFIPVFKTKRITEKYILSKLATQFNSHFFPMIEWTKEQNEPSIIKYKDILENVIHIESLYRKPNIKLDSIINESLVLFCEKHIIPCIKILSNEAHDNINRIEYFINEEKVRGKNIAINISVENDLDSFKKISLHLTKEDFLIIDIGLNNLRSVKILNIINSLLSKQTNIIILSEERNTDLGNKTYSEFDYNKRLFNFSVIDSIKNLSFNFDGFASYCTLKNDLTGEDQIVTNSYAILFLYSFIKNDVFTIRRNTNEHIATSYKNLTDDILCDTEKYNKVVELIKKSPLAGDVFKGICESKKGSVVKYQEIASLHYIETILDNIIQ